MNLEQIKGIFVPIITPVTEDEKVDVKRLKEQVKTHSFR